MGALTLHNVVGAWADNTAAGDRGEADLEDALASVLAVHDARGSVNRVGDEAEEATCIVDADGAVVVEGVVGGSALAAGSEEGKSAGYLIPSAQILGQIIRKVGVRRWVEALSIVKCGIDASGVGGARHCSVCGRGGCKRRQGRDEELEGVHLDLLQYRRCVAVLELQMLLLRSAAFSKYFTVPDNTSSYRH